MLGAVSTASGFRRPEGPRFPAKMSEGNRYALLTRGPWLEETLVNLSWKSRKSTPSSKP